VNDHYYLNSSKKYYLWTNFVDITPTLDNELTSKFYVDTEINTTAKLASENTFTANQSITGDWSESGLITQSNTIHFKAYYNLCSMALMWQQEIISHIIQRNMILEMDTPALIICM
jgi:hypothetical protein